MLRIVLEHCQQCTIPYSPQLKSWYSEGQHLMNTHSSYLANLFWTDSNSFFLWKRVFDKLSIWLSAFSLSCFPFVSCFDKSLILSRSIIVIFILCITLLSCTLGFFFLIKTPDFWQTVKYFFVENVDKNYHNLKRYYIYFFK